jgi:hypothetical protein
MRTCNGAWRSDVGRFISRIESEMAETSARIEESVQSGVSVTDAARGMRQVRSAKLTAPQRRRVREMLEDGEAYTRAEAIAWVLEMEGA